MSWRLPSWRGGSLRGVVRIRDLLKIRTRPGAGGAAVSGWSTAWTADASFPCRPGRLGHGADILPHDTVLVLGVDGREMSR